VRPCATRLLCGCFTAALLLLYCCFDAVLLLLCGCFTAALLLLYCCFTAAFAAAALLLLSTALLQGGARERGQAALLLLYCCFTAALLLLYCGRWRTRTRSRCSRACTTSTLSSAQATQPTPQVSLLQ
jgi:hypothetical protein